VEVVVLNALADAHEEAKAEHGWAEREAVEAEFAEMTRMITVAYARKAVAETQIMLAGHIPG
jgi:hypothetical protein